MKKYVQFILMIGISYALSSCRIILNTIGPPKQHHFFAKPIALKDTLQVANYIGGYIESNTTQGYSKFQKKENSSPSDEHPDILQAALSFHQHREMINEKTTYNVLTTGYLSYGGSVYGGFINPKNHYSDLPFTKKINPYEKKYFIGFSGGIEAGGTFFINEDKTGLSFSIGYGLNFYYEPFGSMGYMIDQIDTEKLLEVVLVRFSKQTRHSFKLNLLDMNIDIRYTYPNKKGAVGVMAFVNAVSYPAGLILSPFITSRMYGFSAYLNTRRFYFDAQFTKHPILKSPLVSFGVQYNIFLKKKRSVAIQPKIKRSFWKRFSDAFKRPPKKHLKKR